ncbi:MAG: Na(+)-translocating NADH-quinone reductase subunit C [Ignavibacteriae bacterium]|nr:Na(+)-translocating NADH-quinone reductase subunit C [Ignavibacteriota bacterium]MCB0746550.1 Na(+)-translocating NADH-quinone reductase subunit C [Ignavibacteriota bacterium]
MASEKISKTIGVVVGICFVAAIFVSSAAVGLKPIQDENKKLDLLKNILIAGKLYEDGKTNINETYNSKISAEIINLGTGEIVPKSEYDNVLNVEGFDLKTVAASKDHGQEIPPNKDIAGIKRMPKEMAIYMVEENGSVKKYIFPIYGKGLWSTLYGFIALDSDLKTIEGFTFYEHGETPGLGGEVDNPKWKQKWVGKQAYSEDWNVQIEVIKGEVDQSSPKSKYQVDGLSGSTLTTRGVSNLVQFWLGENGYKPFITKLREEGSNEKI